MSSAQAILNLPDFETPGGIFSAAVLAVKLVALLDASLRPRRVFIAADKLTKPGWILILATFTVAHVFMSQLSLIGLRILGCTDLPLDGGNGYRGSEQQGKRGKCKLQKRIPCRSCARRSIHFCDLRWAIRLCGDHREILSRLPLRVKQIRGQS